MANSVVERSPVSMVTQLVQHMERRVGRMAWEAAEEVAARPRGQQLFRQADRLMEMLERVARALVRALNRPWRRSDADGNRRDIWGQAPMPLKTAIPLLFLVLPSFMAGVIVMMAPFIPILIIRLITGPYHVLEECWPTPSNIEKCLRRWRRRLRGIRFSGLRKMRIMSIIAFDKLEETLRRREENEKGEEEEVEENLDDEDDDLEDEDSLLGTMLIWWPITVLTLCGQILGLGGPWVPSFNSPVRNKVALESSGIPSTEANILQSDAENISPRKRKFLDFDADSLPTNQEIPYGHGEILHPTSKSHALEPDEDTNDSSTNSSSEYETDSDSETLANSEDLSKPEIQPKRLSPLMKLLTDSPLPSDGEEDDPNYEPNPEESDEDDDVSEGYEDDENETDKEIEETKAKEPKKSEVETKESKGLESEKIEEMETKSDGKETEESLQKETKELARKVFLEHQEIFDKTLTPRSAQEINFE